LEVGVDLFAPELQAAEGKEGKQGGHPVAQQRVPEDLPADVLELDFLDKTVGDDARGGQGREGAGVGTVDDHEGHQEGADARLGAERHPDGSQDDGGGDVAGADGREHHGQDEEDDGQHAHDAARALHGPLGEFFHGAVDGGHAEEQRGAHEDHEQPQGKELVEVRHLHHAARGHGDEEPEGDAHDSDVTFRNAADDDGDEQRHQGEDAQKFLLGRPAPEHAAQGVAADDEAGGNEQKSEQQIPLKIHEDSLRLLVG